MTEPTQTPNPSRLIQPRRLRRRRWIMAGIFALVFLAGMVAGSAVATRVITDQFRLRPRDPHAIPQRITRRMQRKLNLSDEQSRQIQTILTNRLDSLLAMHHGLKPQIKSEIQRTENEVAQVLTPSQAQKWRRWFNRRFREHWASPPPPPRGPPLNRK